MSAPQGQAGQGMRTRNVLVRLAKGIFLGFAFGFLFVLLALFISALAPGSTNPAIVFLSNPAYMFPFGMFLGIGIELLPELEKES